MRTALRGSGPDLEITHVRINASRMRFDPADFLADTGAVTTIINLKREATVFSQGDPADTVFYIQKGQVELDVISKNDKKATIAQLGVGDFIGEECIEPDHTIRIATATALKECTLLGIGRGEMLRVLHEEAGFSSLFVSYLLGRSARLEADLAE
jgi:CRP/FNR family cyclic AMP-dependent transcriptional regulator